MPPAVAYSPAVEYKGHQISLKPHFHESLDWVTQKYFIPISQGGMTSNEVKHCKC